MNIGLVGPAKYFFYFVPTALFSYLILLIGIIIFTYVITIRIAPLVRALSDNRYDYFFARIKNFFNIWFIQRRHPRYLFAGILHILIFAGFIILGIRTISLVIVGLYDGFVFPGFDGILGDIYNVLKDYTVTIVLITCIVAGIRRGILKPERYQVPVNYGKDKTLEAIFVLGVIGILMVSEAFFEASYIAFNSKNVINSFFLAPLTLVWFLEKIFSSFSNELLQSLHIISYYIHDIMFFFFLCYLPFGKHFHVLTSPFNVFFMRITKGNIKPIRYGITDDQLDKVDSFGIKKLEDFTWKHILDFYSCADCGRCSDNCPANISGRPLSPRFFSIKGRNLIFKNYPIYPYGSEFLRSKELIGNIYNEDEIWSCTTCGACEQECPLGIEYIDKIVDLRRSMVDDGNVPQSIQKAFKALEKRGNPWGKMERIRDKWTETLPDTSKIKILNKKDKVNILYFVDSITSYDDRMQSIACATANILSEVESNFGILGKNEKDAGNEIKRFGEEMLFQKLRNSNIECIVNSSAKKIITSDPHAFNVLKNEYSNIPSVEHITQFVANLILLGKIRLKKELIDSKKVYTYHDPCYLGRHNNVYEAPRLVIDAMKLSYVEMKKNKDRSFCCGGGGLMLFYEPKEEQRMGVLRVKMAVEAGANVIVTSCPYCLVNIEDAIKISGLEDKIDVIDFSELVIEHMVL